MKIAFFEQEGHRGSLTHTQNCNNNSPFVLHLMKEFKNRFGMQMPHDDSIPFTSP